jgi:hypothetical protein
MKKNVHASYYFLKVIFFKTAYIQIPISFLSS